MPLTSKPQKATNSTNPPKTIPKNPTTVSAAKKTNPTSKPVAPTKAPTKTSSTTFSAAPKTQPNKPSAPRPAVLSDSKTKITRQKLAETAASHRVLKPKVSISNESWKNQPAPKIPVAKTLSQPKARVGKDSDSSGLWSDSECSDSEISNTSTESKERLLEFVRTKTLKVQLDPQICARTWKVSKVNFKRINLAKCTVSELRFGLEYYTGIPMEITYLRFQGKEMNDMDDLEMAALDGGNVTLCVFSLWTDFVRTLFTGNVEAIRKAVNLEDDKSATLKEEHIVDLIPAWTEDGSGDPFNPDLVPNGDPEIEHARKRALWCKNLTVKKSSSLITVKSKNLVTDEMRTQIKQERLYFALLFAIINSHERLWNALVSGKEFDQNHRFASGRSLLFFAIGARNTKKYFSLKAAGADLKSPDKLGVPPDALAKMAKAKDILKDFEEIKKAESAAKRGITIGSKKVK